MSGKIFTKEEWLKALEGLKGTYKVFVPGKDGDFHDFRSLDEVDVADFGYGNTRMSPKSLV